MLKKLFLILCFLFLFSTAISGGITDKLKQVIARKNVAAGDGGDDCSGALVMSIHFEDNSDPTSIADSGGCTDGSDDSVDLVGTWVISTTVGTHDGSTYTAYSGTGEQATHLMVDATGIAAGVSSIGTICMDYYKSLANEGYIFNIGPIGTVLDGGGANDNSIRVNYAANNQATSATFADDTWVRLCFSWDESQTGTDDNLSVQVEGNAWETKTSITLADMGLDDPMNMGGDAWNYTRGYVDNIKLYSTYQAEDNS